MSERPNVLLAILIGAAATVSAALLTGLVISGGCQITDVPSIALAALSACFLFVEHVHRVPLSWLVLVVVALVSTFSLSRVAIAWARAHRLLVRLPLEPLGEGPLAAIAAATRVRLYTTPAARPAAFCIGLLRPRVVITSGLLGALTAEEQAAAVWHEAHHASRHEPLKCFAGRLATSALFWLPAFRDLFERYLLAKELVADQLAIRKTGLPALAGALSAAAPAPVGALGLADFASARVERLLDPQAKLPPLFGGRRLVATALGLAGVLLLFALPWTVDVDPAHLRALLELIGP